MDGWDRDKPSQALRCQDTKFHFMVRLPALRCDAVGTLDDNGFQWQFQQSVAAMAEHETNNY